MVGTKLKSIE